jgi:hypothetical protein
MGGTREDGCDKVPTIGGVAEVVWVRLPEFMGGYDVMLVVHEIVDETNELGLLVATVGKVNEPTIETVD